MVEDLIRQYINQAKVMQLATTVDNQPWVCHLHFYADEALNLYWISTEVRRHSLEIATNPKVAVTILVHENTEQENYVIGLSITGKAELLGDDIDKKIAESYVKKTARAASLVEDIKSGKNPHKFYRIKPSKIVLFDSKDFPENPRQEWQP